MRMLLAAVVVHAEATRRDDAGAKAGQQARFVGARLASPGAGAGRVVLARDRPAYHEDDGPMAHRRAGAGHIAQPEDGGGGVETAMDGLDRPVRGDSPRIRRRHGRRPRRERRARARGQVGRPPCLPLRVDPRRLSTQRPAPGARARLSTAVGSLPSMRPRQVAISAGSNAPASSAASSTSIPRAPPGDQRAQHRAVERRQFGDGEHQPRPASGRTAPRQSARRPPGRCAGAAGSEARHHRPTPRPATGCSASAT